jgi:hypothetical protein
MKINILKFAPFFTIIPLLFVFFPALVKADSGDVVYFDFNNLAASSTSFVDQSGNGNAGDIYGAQVVGGVSGTALYFNGSNSYAEVPNSDKLNFGTGDFTLSVWVKTIATSIGEAEGRGDIIDKGDPYNSGYSISSMNNRASSLVGNSARIGYGGYCGNTPIDPLDYNTYVCPFDKFINDGVWHNIVSVRQNGVVKIYLDTQLVHQYSNADDVSTADNIIIGRHGEKDESFFRGKIDEVNILNYALSQAEINTAYTNIKIGYISSTETTFDNTLGFDYQTAFNPANDGNYTYTVKAGDTARDISAEQCGQPDWWKSMIDPLAFHDANRNKILWVGGQIKLSAAQCQPPSENGSFSQADASQTQAYLINSGDTLWSIAQKICGSGFAWIKMFTPNSFTQVDGNIIIKSGDTLTLNPGLCQ